MPHILESRPCYMQHFIAYNTTQARVCLSSNNNTVNAPTIAYPRNQAFLNENIIHHSPRKGHCFLACSGTSFTKISAGTFFNSCGLKLNRGGKKRPFGRRVVGSRSSSKKGWTNASKAVHRRLGEYWSSLDTRSTASGGIRLWKILCHG